MKKESIFLKKSKILTPEKLHNQMIYPYCSYKLHHNFWKKINKLKTNYRSVTILQTVSKIYEWCLYEQIDEYFQPLFSKLQCGFRKGHSAQHCLLVLIKECCKVLDIRGFDGLLLTDLSKPFGCIDHELLIEKLHAYSFDIKLWRIQVVLETGIPVWVLKLWHLKNTFQFFFFSFILTKNTLR